MWRLKTKLKIKNIRPLLSIKILESRVFFLTSIYKKQFTDKLRLHIM